LAPGGGLFLSHAEITAIVNPAVTTAIDRRTRLSVLGFGMTGH
jgi:hypothetical protein